MAKKDFVYIHMEATDEAGHKGDAAAKVKAIELIDELVVGALEQGLQGQDWRMLVTPDHATPLEARTHTDEAVPYFIYDSRQNGDGAGHSRQDGGAKARYTEATAKAAGRHFEDGWDLMAEFLQKQPSAGKA